MGKISIRQARSSNKKVYLGVGGRNLALPAGLITYRRKWPEREQGAQQGEDQLEPSESWKKGASHEETILE